MSRKRERPPVFSQLDRLAEYDTSRRRPDQFRHIGGREIPLDRIYPREGAAFIEDDDDDEI